MVIAGIDEAGRGPLAGPVISAVVILNPKKRINGLRDSKILTPEKRATLFDKIIKNAIAFAIGRAEVEEIDRLNILQATLLSMQRAVQALQIKPNHILVDGNRCPNLDFSTEAIVDGDKKIKEISAASILAKVTRDREMIELDKKFPEYGFAKHKGYGTKEHLLALNKYGPCSIHRRSFAPVKLAATENANLNDLIASLGEMGFSENVNSSFETTNIAKIVKIAEIAKITKIAETNEIAET